MCFPRELGQSFFKTMHLDASRLLLAFKSILSTEEISSLLNDLNLVMEELPDDPLPVLDGYTKKLNNDPDRLWVRSSNGLPISSYVIAQIENRFEKYFSWVGPVYRMKGSIDQSGFVCPLPNAILINPFEGLSMNRYTMLLKMIEKYEMEEISRKSPKFSGYHYYSISNPRKNPSWMVKTVFEHLADVVFEMVPLIHPASVEHHHRQCALQAG